MTKVIRAIFTQILPGHSALRLVSFQDEDGKDIDDSEAGEWSADGEHECLELRLATGEDAKPAEPAPDNWQPPALEWHNIITHGGDCLLARFENFEARISLRGASPLYIDEKKAHFQAEFNGYARHLLKLLGTTPLAATAEYGGKPNELWKWPVGTKVRKHSGSWWEGEVVGFYSTAQTPHGYAVQLQEPGGNGPVQIYPEGALREMK
jgi:hypothetical protein